MGHLGRMRGLTSNEAPNNGSVVHSKASRNFFEDNVVLSDKELSSVGNFRVHTLMCDELKRSVIKVIFRPSAAS